MTHMDKHNLIRIIIAIVVCLVIISIPLTVMLISRDIDDAVTTPPPSIEENEDGEDIPPPVEEGESEGDKPHEEVTHPETVTFAIEIGCASLFEEAGAKYIEDIHRALGDELFAALNGGDMVPLTTMTMPYGSSVMDATRAVLEENNIAIGGTDKYIASIGGLREKMAGKMSGWVYSINGNPVMVGAGTRRIREGDVIKWIYLVD